MWHGWLWRICHAADPKGNRRWESYLLMPSGCAGTGIARCPMIQGMRGIMTFVEPDPHFHARIAYKVVLYMPFNVNGLIGSNSNAEPHEATFKSSIKSTLFRARLYIHAPFQEHHRALQCQMPVLASLCCPCLPNSPRKASSWVLWKLSVWHWSICLSMALIGECGCTHRHVSLQDMNLNHKCGIDFICVNEHRNCMVENEYLSVLQLWMINANKLQAWHG